jgi:hypothetical protein
MLLHIQKLVQNKYTVRLVRPGLENGASKYFRSKLNIFIFVAIFREAKGGGGVGLCWPHISKQNKRPAHHKQTQNLENS